MSSSVSRGFAHPEFPGPKHFDNKVNADIFNYKVQYRRYTLGQKHMSQRYKKRFCRSINFAFTLIRTPFSHLIDFKRNKIIIIKKSLL